MIRRPERYPARGIKERASKRQRVMSRQRQKNRPEQGVLAFPAESRSDAPKAAAKETEMLMAKHRTESLAGTERLMEEVYELENCKQALQRVKANKGSPGVDGMTVGELPRRRIAPPRPSLALRRGFGNRHSKRGKSGMLKSGKQGAAKDYAKSQKLEARS